MKDEIKQMIDNLKFISEQESATIEINQNGCKVILDCITNLQEKVNQYENPDDLTLFYMWMDEKAKDKIKELQDEIQNLRDSLKTYEILLKTNVEENERLKELCDKYEEEHNTAFKLWTQKMEEMPDYEEFVDYKSRNEKAINILELSSQNKSMCTRPETDTIQSALNILKGGISKYE